MASKIKFVRHYHWYREDYFDVVYTCGRIRTFRLTELPKTVQSFINSAENVKHQNDRTFNRDEWIYTA